jgi:hypothetical protein
MSDVNIKLLCNENTYIATLQISGGDPYVGGIKAFDQSGSLLGSYGTPQDSYQTFTFRADEFITDYVVWGTTWGGGRVAGLKITTKDSAGNIRVQTVGHDQGAQSASNSFTSGTKLVGLWGWAGSDIDSLNLVLSYPVRSYAFKDIKYSHADPTINPSNIEQILIGIVSTAIPPGVSGGSLTATASESLANTATFTSSHLITIGTSASATFSPPSPTGGVGLSATASASGTTSTGNSVTVTDTVTLTATQVLTPLNPGYKYELDLLLTQPAIIELDYTGTLECTYEDGTTSSFPESGTATISWGASIDFQARSPVHLTQAEITNLGNANAPITTTSTSSPSVSLKVH